MDQHSIAIQKLMEECNQHLYNKDGQWESAANRLLAIAKEECDIKAQAFAYLSLGQAAYFTSEVDLALSYLYSSISLCSKENFSNLLGSCFSMLAMVQYTKGQEDRKSVV